MDEITELSQADFPSPLLEIPQPPARLYIRGRLPPSEYCYLCVIGSRKYTPYGEKVTNLLISGLAGYGVAIVSGLALGIDSIAHKAALKASLPTVAVPGSGLNWDVIYPRSHVGLARDILSHGGCLLSEFEPGYQATIQGFPQRNRIEAGLCRATLVIEAGAPSGTLITARLATEYNRDVLAVPNSIFSPNSRGTSFLLKQGATLIASPEDLIEALKVRETAPLAFAK